MKRLLAGVVMVLLFCSFTKANARAVRIWSYNELLEKADLVVIAVPIATNDTTEQIKFPGFGNQPVVGVETRFTVSAALKGGKRFGGFTLHHYRFGSNGFVVPNGPNFVSFSIPDGPNEFAKAYLLFLTNEPDGRSAPVAGQADPWLSIRQLDNTSGGVIVASQARLDVDAANALLACQTIKPGMTRADLSKLFRTEGGISTARRRTYVYRGCDVIKVDCDFNPSDPKQDALDERATDTIATISRPYLDWSIGD